jgi:hypothetical protein
METRPPEKRLRMAPFAVHATRGVLRDQKARRKTMTLLLVGALLLIGSGLVGAKSWLEPHEHPVRFVSFWFACGWITLTALLLALMDLLLLRGKTRRTERELREELEKPDESGE